MRLKSLLANGLLTFGSVLVCLLLAEAALRFLPVNEGFNFLDTDAADPVFRATPNQDVVSSKRWDFDQAQVLHVNNAGFRNDQDYAAPDQAGRRDRPLIAIVGDSYVEAIQVSYAESFFGRLAADLAPHADVYSFGFSGAPLSQYLIWARYAHQTFRNDHLVVNVVGNDFDESLARYKQWPGFFYYSDCAGGTTCLKLVELHRGRFVPAMKSSALIRYVVYNLDGVAVLKNAGALWERLFATESEPTFVGNVPAAVSDRRLQDSLMAADLFLGDIAGYAGLPPERITFVVDGRVYHTNDAAFDRSYFGKLREHFIRNARARGFSVIDMRPVFSRHYAAHGIRFESAEDGHWNALGHGLVAGELADHFRFLAE